jgi:hypothetical protein
MIFIALILRLGFYLLNVINRLPAVGQVKDKQIDGMGMLTYAG